MANDRLAGTYIIPDAHGSRVRGEPDGHPPIAIALVDMYGAGSSDFGDMKICYE